MISDEEKTIEIVRPVRQTYSGSIRETITHILAVIVEYFAQNKLYIRVPKALHNIPNTAEHNRALVLLSQLYAQGHTGAAESQANLPDEPQLHVYTVYPENSEYPGARGGDFFSDTLALQRMLSEYMERTVWYGYEAPKKMLRTATIREIGSKIAFPLDTLAGFSPKHKDTIPHLQFSPSTMFTWLPVRTFSTLPRIRWCPAQLVNAFYMRRGMQHEPFEPLLRHNTTNGLATSWVSQKEAVVRGCLELIERDAFMIAYGNKLSPDTIDQQHVAHQSARIKDVLQRITSKHLEVTLLRLPTDFPVHVTFACVVDRTGAGPAFVAGCSASFNLEQSILSALNETIAIRYEMRMGEQWKKDLGELPENPTLQQRLAFWCKLENLPLVDFLYKGKKVQPNLDESTPSVSKQFRILKRALKEKGYHACFFAFPHTFPRYVHIAQVVIPELIPLHITGLPKYTHSERYTQIPKQFGFTPAQELNDVPGPFG